MATLTEDIQRLTGIDVRRCGAVDASALPSAIRDALDLLPDQLVAAVLADERDKVLGSCSIWLLSGCPAKRIACADGSDFAPILATLRQIAIESRVVPAEPEVARLMQAFASQVRARGRAHHRALLKGMRLHAEKPLTEPVQELAMVLKRKLRACAPKVRDVEGVRKALDTRSAEGGGSA